MTVMTRSAGWFVWENHGTESSISLFLVSEWVAGGPVEPQSTWHHLYAGRASTKLF